MTLTLGRNLLKPLDGTEIGESIKSALEKAAAALPPEGHTYVRSLEQLFAVGIGPHKSYREHRRTIDLISQAIDKRRSVGMRYFSASHASTGRREVEPYKLRFAAGGLYLIAYCHLHQEVPLFAVERIGALNLTDRPYRIPLDCKVDEYLQDPLGVMRGGRRIEVEQLFSKKAAAWVRDKQWHPSQETVSLKDGRMTMKLKVANNEELVGWILSFGGAVKVLGPDELGNKVEAEVKCIVRNSGQRSGGRRHNHEPHGAAHTERAKNCAFSRSQPDPFTRSG